MNLARAFDAPLIRIPLLVAAMAATVATTRPAWSTEARTETRDVHLAPSAATVREVGFDGSDRVGVLIQLERISSTSGKLRVKNDDSRPGCSFDATLETTDGRWRVVSTASGEPRFDPPLSIWGWCDGKQGTARVEVTNAGTEAIDFAWRIDATVGGLGELGDEIDPPDDAFVELRETTPAP